MNLKKVLIRKNIIVFLILIVGYLIVRLTNLSSLPIFTDEAIYLRWAQIAKNDSSWRFISLTDGKQPLFVWLAMVLMKLIQDPLLAGRLVSVWAGFFSLIGIGLLGFYLFKDRRVGFLSSFLYLVTPFFLFYDRIALMDALVATFAIWSLLFQVLLIRTLRLDVAFLLGFILGGGILTKTSGFFNIYLLPFSLFLFDWRKKSKLIRLLKWAGLVLISVVLSFAFYSILRLSPWFHMIAQKDTTFIYTFKEFLSHPFPNLWGNLKGLSDWLITYITWPTSLLVLVSLLMQVKEKSKEKLLLFLWFLIPFLALASFGKVIYPRFILFMSAPLLVLAAQFLARIHQKVKNVLLLYILYLILFFFPFYFDSKIIFDIVNTPLPSTDRGQYLDDWPSGYGVKEVVGFLEQEAKRNKVFVGTDGTFGLFPASLELYLVENKNIEIQGFYPLNEKALEKLLEKAKEKPTYLVLKETQKAPVDWPLKLIFKVRKGKGKVFLHFYQVAIRS